MGNKEKLVMAGIETRVTCPECGTELNFVLKITKTSKGLRSIMSGLGIKPRPELKRRFIGLTRCPCGKWIKAEYRIKAADDPINLMPWR